MYTQRRQYLQLLLAFFVVASGWGERWCSIIPKIKPFDSVSVGIGRSISQKGKFLNFPRRQQQCQQLETQSSTTTDSHHQHEHPSRCGQRGGRRLGRGKVFAESVTPKVAQEESLVVPVSNLKYGRSKAMQRIGKIYVPIDVEKNDVIQASTVAKKRLVKQKRKGIEPNEDDKSSSIERVSAIQGGARGIAGPRPLVFWENMVCGAVSRSVAQTTMHPANTMKTILQSTTGADRPTLIQLMQPSMFKMLTRGAGANFVLSVPHGAVNFAVLEFVRGRMNKVVESIPALARRANSIGPGLDFASSAISTICCSIVSTPQMMITDNIMAGNYEGMVSAAKGLHQSGGVSAFYAGWWPGLVGKIPSYALTWTFFQQLKRMRDRFSDRPATNIENSIMGCISSGTTVCIMIPMDTIKTRLVTQFSNKALTGAPYKGIIDCGVRIMREEGIGAFYRGLPPRLVSVVPMIGIQFGVYEAMKKVMVQRKVSEKTQQQQQQQVVDEQRLERYSTEETLEEVVMEVAASSGKPFPAPRFLKNFVENQKKKNGWNTPSAKGLI